MKRTSGLFSGTTGAKKVIGTALSVSPKTFSSPDPLVGDLATDIEKTYTGKVLGVNVDVFDSTGKKVTDLDIETDSMVVQVKSGRGTGLTKQMIKTQSVTSKEVVAYGPKLGKHVIKSVEALGFKVFTEKGKLLDYMGGK